MEVQINKSALGYLYLSLLFHAVKSSLYDDSSIHEVKNMIRKVKYVEFGLVYGFYIGSSLITEQLKSFGLLTSLIGMFFLYALKYTYGQALARS